MPDSCQVWILSSDLASLNIPSMNSNHFNAVCKKAPTKQYNLHLVALMFP